MMPGDIEQIQIYCESPEVVKNRMIFLFSKGLVFTGNRIRDWEGVQADFCHDLTQWTHIRFGHNVDCLRVFNTSIGRKFGIKTITWEDFVDRILPLL